MQRLPRRSFARAATLAGLGLAAPAALADAPEGPELDIEADFATYVLGAEVATVEAILATPEGWARRPEAAEGRWQVIPAGAGRVLALALRLGPAAPVARPEAR